MKAGKHPYLDRIYRDFSFGEAAQFISQKYRDRGKDRITDRTFNFEMAELARLNDSERTKRKRDVLGKTGQSLEDHYSGLQLGLGGYYQHGGEIENEETFSQDMYKEMVGKMAPEQAASKLEALNYKMDKDINYQVNPFFYEALQERSAPLSPKPFDENPMGDIQPTSTGVNKSLPMIDSSKLRQFAGGGDLSSKISKLVREGYPQKQAIAIAHSMKRRKKLQEGGPIGVPESENIFWLAQQQRPDVETQSLPTLKLPTSLSPMNRGANTQVVQPLPTRSQPGSLQYDTANLPATPTEPLSSTSERQSGLSRTLSDVGSYLKDDIYAPGAVGTALNLGINAAMLAGGYDKVPPVYNPHEQDIKRLMQDRGADFTALENQALAGYNLAANSAGQSRSAALRNTLVQNAASNLSTNLSDIKLKEQQYMDAVKQQYASVLNNLGAQRVQGDVRAEELTQRAKGQYQTQLSQFGAQLAGTGQFLTRLRANKQMNEMYSNILSAKYFDFGISKDLYNKVVRGEELSEQEIFQLKTSPYATQLEELAQWARSSKKTTTQ